MTINMAIVMKSEFVLVALCLIFSVVSAGLLTGPLHASCNVDWTISAVSCKDAAERLGSVIKQWAGADNCQNGGEKCLYTLVSMTSEEIKAVHETPKKHYKDDLTLTLKPCGSGCCIHGYSTSETWYAHLDYSTNFCNLRNLIDGADLSRDPGFVETTSNKICTQYSSANCDKY